MSPRRLTRYAERTTVPVPVTRQELEALLTRHGADAIVVGFDGPVWTVACRLGGHHLKWVVRRPGEQDEAVRYFPGGQPRRPNQLAGAILDEERRRWRALLLIVKAKLEMIAGGDATVEEEFLANIMLPDGSTVGEWAAQQVDEVYRTHTMPALLPGATPRALGPGQGDR